MSGRVASLSAKPETPGEAGLPKRLVASLVVSPAGAAGDYNRYRTQTLQGDPDSALLLLTEEVLLALQREGWPVAPGDLGENVLLAGIPERVLAPGVRLALGSARVELSRACEPCSELYLLSYVGSARGPEFVRTLKDRRGWYARVLAAGRLATGDPVRIEEA